MKEFLQILFGCCGSRIDSDPSLLSQVYSIHNNPIFFHGCPNPNLFILRKKTYAKFIGEYRPIAPFFLRSSRRREIGERKHTITRKQQDLRGSTNFIYIHGHTRDFPCFCYLRKSYKKIYNFHSIVSRLFILTCISWIYRELSVAPDPQLINTFVYLILNWSVTVYILL